MLRSVIAIAIGFGILVVGMGIGTVVLIMTGTLSAARGENTVIDLTPFFWLELSLGSVLACIGGVVCRGVSRGKMWPVCALGAMILMLGLLEAASVLSGAEAKAAGIEIIVAPKWLAIGAPVAAAAMAVIGGKGMGRRGWGEAL